MDEETMTQEELREEQQVDEVFQMLVQSYLATKHRKKVALITKAFNFARHAHKGVRRLSGEPYIMHPLAVAQIVCTEIGLGSTSICSALLHDVVEDTDYTVEDIENIFGKKIAQIVDGLTKISGGIFGENASAQAENFKKLLLTMGEDIRVILVKMADRLHNMRTLASQPLNKQHKIAGETLYIYAPLAHRLGLNAIKTELENLSFRYEHPHEHETILKKLASTEAERTTVFEEFTAPIRERLNEMGVDYTLKARIKTPYSIWHKMQTKHIPFEEVYDLLAVRIVFKPKNLNTEVNECFDIYIALTEIYKSHPERLRDWIHHPKSNGYRALHVTLMSNKGEWIEVQIRSERMDDIAEKGFAAHWKYKDGETSEDEHESELDKWLTTIKEILDDPQPDSIDLLDTIKLNLYASEIFVFTPKGELRTLPAGSTALDFAFSIHTFIGSHCIGAKVNHKLVPMSHKLQSGDQVEILTSNTSHVTRAWLNIATTAKATTKILNIVRREERETRRKGEAMLDEFLKKNELQKSSVNMEKLRDRHSCKNLYMLYLNVGNGAIKLSDEDVKLLTGKEESASAWKRLFSFGRKPKKRVEKSTVVAKNLDKKKILILNEDNIQKDYSLAACCAPIPGDSVMGFIDDNETIVIHKLNCPVAARLKANHGNRILAAQWSDQPVRKLFFPGNIHMEGIDRIGLLNQVTQIISNQLNVNIHRLDVNCEEGIFTCDVQLYVHDKNEVETVVKSLQTIDSLTLVARV